MEQLFDLSAEYDVMLNKGLSVSGEDKFFFIKGRVDDLYKVLPENFEPLNILDFGCGIGDTTKYLSEKFPNSNLLGVDLADEAIKFAQSRFGDKRIKFASLHELKAQTGKFDLAYVNGVFHHIEAPKRVEAAKLVFDALALKGYFALFENNPWNPGTRLVMSRIPFDRDAVTLNFFEAKKLLRAAGFSDLFPARFLFYFPKMLKGLRKIEKYFVNIPMGAQYYILAKKK